MARRSRHETDSVDAMLASIYPVTRASLKTDEIDRAQREIGAAISSMPQSSHRAKRWGWAARPRHVLLVGAAIVGLGGSIAAAAVLLSAHTGFYPTRSGIPINMSGPGEDLNTEAPNFCQVALQVTSDIPFPARYAAWRAEIVGFEFQIKHVSSSIPCNSHGGGHVTTGWLDQWVAASAFCGWAQAWAYDVGAGDRAGAAHDAAVIASALNWNAVRWNDPHPDGSPAGDAPGGTRTRTPFGWILAYQRAVRSNNRAEVEQLLAGGQGFGECQNFDLDLINFINRHLAGTSTTKSESIQLFLQHLRSEGI